jgi:hypothetical protein
MARRVEFRLRARVPFCLADSRTSPMAALQKAQRSNFRQYARKTSQDDTVVLGRPAIYLLIAVVVAGISLGSAQGQEQKHKVPGLGKIISGSNNQAFDGIVQSLDLKRKILNVSTVQSGATETFSVPKNANVVTADGDKRTLAALTPGTNVFVVYEQKGDRRTVKQIVIVTAGPKAAKKAAPPS